MKAVFKMWRKLAICCKGPSIIRVIKGGLDRPNQGKGDGVFQNRGGGGRGASNNKKIISGRSLMTLLLCLWYVLEFLHTAGAASVHTKKK